MDYVLLVMVAVISSVGVAGVPGPASISTTVVLTALGLPIEGLGLVLAVDALVDMGRTTVNATGTTVTSLLVAVSEDEFDREAFDRDEEDELEVNYPPSTLRLEVGASKVIVPNGTKFT